MAVVTSCDDGRSVVFESSCVFPHDDEKISSEVVFSGVGNDRYRNEEAFAGQSKKRRNLSLIKMQFVLK